MIQIILLSFFIPQIFYTQDLKLTAPTNQEIQYQANLSNIKIGKSFSVSYQIPNSIMQIINIDSNITALGDTDIAVIRISNRQIDLDVTSYSLIEYPMPSLLITALDTNGNTNLFYTPSFTIPISNAIVTNTNLTLADIEPIYFIWNHLWTLIILIVLLILIGIYFIPKFHRHKEEIIIEELIDPFERIRKKLNILKVQSVNLSEETYKDFFVELSETIREFLSDTIVPLALELPTRDIITAMKQTKLQNELQEIISSLLKNTDRAKYAKQIFAQERINEVVNDSFQLTKLIQQKYNLEKAHELRKP
ncbi:MAG: hypothetical protein ACRCWI_03535 [Brevinema sp.]